MSTIDPQRYVAALQFAAEAHGNQLRKGSAIPYITHPVAVSALLAQYGFAEEVVIAGVLHDTIEDGGITAEEIAARFGPRVAKLVTAVSEEKTRLGIRVPWRERKEQQLAHLAAADLETAALKAADALHNLQSILRDLRVCGERAWARFNAPKAEQIWYFTAVARSAAAKLGELGLAAELREAADALGRS